MKSIISVILIVLILTIFLVASGALYTVDETQQAVITQFGELKGDPKTSAGLYIKMPFIQQVNYFDKRILQWDGDPNQIPTRDKRYIWVDTTARWRIADPVKFMQSVRTEISAQARLDDIIDAATRDSISSNVLVETVRDSNRLIERDKVRAAEEEIDFGKTILEKIDLGREALGKQILNISSGSVPKYGIELVDVRIKRINYVQEVKNKVYERMISERKRAAEQFRSEGQGKKAEIDGQMKKELEQIRSEAYKKAQEIKGKADAEAIKIYAEAYNKDPEFYSFINTLESYKVTVGEDTNFIMTTDNDFFGYLKDYSEGKTQ